MSWFFESFTCPPKDVMNNYSFVGEDTGKPSRLFTEVFLDENEASNALCDKVGKSEAGYALAYDVEGHKVENSQIKAINAKIKTLLGRRQVYALKQLEKALSYETRTCPCCQRKVYMRHYEGTLRFWQREGDREYTTSMTCHECRSREALPFTKPQRAKLNEYNAKLSDLIEARHQARLAHCAKLHKQKKIKKVAVVVGCLHESLECKYNDDCY